MSRILTGVQSTGTPHLGNLLGAIIPAIEMSKNSNIENAGPQEPLEKESQSSPSPFKNRTTKSQRFQMNMRRTTLISKGGIKRGVRSKKL